MHTDEAVNASIQASMLEGAPYRYDPQDRHGPVLHYLANPILRLAGFGHLGEMESWHLRLLPALAGALLLLLVPLLRDGLPACSGVAALAWLTLGAPFVYYGRTFIHETLFVLFTLAALACGWRFVRTGRPGWSIAAGISAGLMIGTKETSLIAVSVGVAALLLTLAVVGRQVSAHPLSRRQLWRGAAAAALAVASMTALLYSSFGTHPQGLLELCSGLFRTAERAQGEGHEKPWFTYLQWCFSPNVRSLPWFGWTLLPCFALGATAAWLRRREFPLGLFLALYALGTLAAYSLIPYKTPWLMLNFLAPAVLVGAVGLGVALERLAGRHSVLVSVVVLALLLFGLGGETRRLCFHFPSDPYNPLAYSPTVRDAERLQEALERIALATPGGLDTPIQVIGSDLWPLPWYLRHFEKVGFWTRSDTPLLAPVVICSTAEAPHVAQRLGGGWTQSYFGLRPEVLVVVFLNNASFGGEVHL